MVPHGMGRKPSCAICVGLNNEAFLLELSGIEGENDLNMRWQQFFHTLLKVHGGVS